MHNSCLTRYIHLNTSHVTTSHINSRPFIFTLHQAFLAGLQTFLAGDAGAELLGPAGEPPASRPLLSVAPGPCRPQGPCRPSTSFRSLPLPGLPPPGVQVWGAQTPALVGGAAAGMRLWLLVEDEDARSATTATSCFCR